MNVIFCNLERIHTEASFDPVEIIQRPNQSTIKNGSIVLPMNEGNFNEILNSNYDIYIPAGNIVDPIYKRNNLNVYFDLEQYAFYDKTRSLIEGNSRLQGVFRLRRMLKTHEIETIIVEDLYVLSTIFGDIKDVQINQTDSLLETKHIIIMISYIDGIIAHIEYTTTEHSRIEIEWSGIGEIIEFDSDQVNENLLGSILNYPIDSIVATAREVNKTLIDRLQYFKTIIDGGFRK